MSDALTLTAVFTPDTDAGTHLGWFERRAPYKNGWVCWSDASDTGNQNILRFDWGQ